MKQETPGTNCIQDRLNELKARYGTQQAFAEAIGVTRNAVSPWLNGDKMPSAAVIADICTACHVSPNWLFGIDDNIPLSLAAMDNIRDCGKQLTHNRAGGNINIFDKQYSDNEYETMRAMIDALLCSEYFYLAIREIYASAEYERCFNQEKDVKGISYRQCRELSLSHDYIARQCLDFCITYLKELTSRR